MKTNPEFIARDIAGELVLVPVGTAAKNYGGLVTCNEVGAFIWKKLEQETTIDELVSAILDEFEIDEATAKADAEEFVGKLKKINAVI
ncbi:MAG: PqqD family protein [Bacillota bacterium]|nr:PqqD family protein [Bacillota bacterium]